MANVSLSSREMKNALRFVSGSTIFMGAVAGSIRLYGFGGDPVTALGLGMISGMGWAVLFSVWVFKLSWKHGWLAWLTGRPIIHGVWFGHLNTSYESGDESVGKRIPIGFVIKQTFLTYSLLSYTERQDSVTLAETLDVDEKHDTVVHLRYMYRFHIMREKERKQTTGAGELRLIENGTKLKGNYLTDSPTHGSIELAFVQRKAEGIDTFEAIRQLYEVKHASACTPTVSTR